MTLPIGRFFRSNIGLKVIMSLSGIFLIIFLIVHLAGNLEIFSGRDAMNDYSILLRKFPKALWAIRIGLIAAFVLHVLSAITLAKRNVAARPERYALKRSRTSTLASRTMLLSGLLVLGFLLYHLAHFTWGLTHADDFVLVDEKGRHDVYGMVVLGFQNIYVAGFYILAQVLLALHLSHGFSSLGQTLGLADRRLTFLLKRTGLAFSVIIFTLYTSIPISIWLGVVTF